MSAIQTAQAQLFDVASVLPEGFEYRPDFVDKAQEQALGSARERVEACYALTDAAPALLVLGSSLAVMSGLRFVRHAAKRGIPVMAVTRGPTRGDDLMTLRVDDSLAPTLGALVRAGVAA